VSAYPAVVYSCPQPDPVIPARVDAVREESRIFSARFHEFMPAGESVGAGEKQLLIDLTSMVSCK